MSAPTEGSQRFREDGWNRSVLHPVYTPNNERLRSNDEYRHCIEHEQLVSTSIDGGDQSGGRLDESIESTPALWLWPVQMSNTKGRIHLNMVTPGDFFVGYWGTV